jgi:hypothetical protein
MTAPQYCGKIFMYPCAGSDIAEPVQVFGAYFDTFLFVDLKYNASCAAPEIPGWYMVEGSQRRFGSSNSAIRHCSVGRSRFRVVDPEWFFADYINEATCRKIVIVRRRGFGQYALHELRDGSLSMFMHRGDSFGEGGSKVFYLANRRTSHAPLSNLMNVLKRKLAYPALIASDGSNTTIRQILEAERGGEPPNAFVSHGLQWQRLHLSDFLQARTKVWQIQPPDLKMQK